MSNHIEIVEAQSLSSERQHSAQVRLKRSIAERLAAIAEMLLHTPDGEVRPALWMVGEALVGILQEIWRVAR